MKFVTLLFTALLNSPLAHGPDTPVDLGLKTGWVGSECGFGWHGGSGKVVSLPCRDTGVRVETAPEQLLGLVYDDASKAEHAPQFVQLGLFGLPSSSTGYRERLFGIFHALARACQRTTHAMLDLFNWAIWRNLRSAPERPICKNCIMDSKIKRPMAFRGIGLLHTGGAWRFAYMVTIPKLFTNNAGLRATATKPKACSITFDFSPPRGRRIGRSSPVPAYIRRRAPFAGIAVALDWSRSCAAIG